MEFNTVQVLVVNTGSTPITTEKHQLPSTEPKKVQQVILDRLNFHGKGAYALVKRSGKIFLANHVSRKGPSKQYFIKEVKYDQYIKELA